MELYDEWWRRDQLHHWLGCERHSGLTTRRAAAAALVFGSCKLPIGVNTTVATFSVRVLPPLVVTAPRSVPPTVTAPTTTGPFSVTLEAESGVVQAPFVIASGSISQTVTTFAAAEGGRAAYTFSVPSAGSYSVTGLVNAPAGDMNSFLISVSIRSHKIR